ncbi:MAG: ATP-binding protein [Bacillota bacterium]|nr:ATP-binding protein [Bacillota bacterium]
MPGKGLRAVFPQRSFAPSRRRGRLGLAIVKRLVELQGGRVGIGEGPEGGADFWFTLPAAHD